jgi:hypothetical protein
MTHTPGPWTLKGIQAQEIHDAEAEYDAYVENEQTMSIVIMGPERPEKGNTKYIAEMDCDPVAASDTLRGVTDSDWANARLIAAAPDLLSALESALLCIGMCWSYGKENGLSKDTLAIAERDFEKARAAIAKARE